MNLWPCTSRALFSANHQRTTSRTDPHTHDPHFSLSSPAVPPARSADRRGRARQSQMHGFLLQKWKQACSCHLNVSPSRKRPESVTHYQHGRKDRPGDRGTARGAKPLVKLAPMPSFEVKLQAQHEPSAHRTDVPRGYKCKTHQDAERNPLACRETLRRMRGRRCKNAQKGPSLL